MPWQSHFNAHYNIGTYIYSGGALTAGTYSVLPSSPTDADNTPGVDAATVYDEDLPTTIGVWSQGTYTTLRFVTSVSTYDTASASLFRVGTTYPRINTGGLSETETSSGQFFNVWGIFVPMAEGTTSQKYRILWMQPQAAFSTSSGAAAESFTSLNIGDLATGFAEYAPRIKVTFATSSSWSGATGRCRIHAVSYLTGTRASSSLAATTSPGGTNGQVQYNNGGAFGGISEGTSGYVLTSNGAGVAPSFQAPTGGTGTDLSYTASTRVLASSTGADATLPLVSSSDAGLAPASGGGTTNFLRADGTWSAPAGGSTDYSCRLRKSTGQSIGTTRTAMTFDVEDFDTDTMHDNSTNNTRITFTHAGKYMVGGNINTSSNAVAGCAIKVDGSTEIAFISVGNAGSSINGGCHISTIYSFTAGQYVELMGQFGSTVTTGNGNDGPQFWAYKIA
jgi:hypothetical protein